MTETQIEARGQLEQLAEQTIAVEGQLGRLAESLFRQREIVERNVRRLTEKTDEDITRLRNEYDRLLDKGAMAEAEKIMKQLAAVHRESVNFARNCLDSDNELAELQDHFESLRLEALELVRKRDDLFKQWKQISNAVQRVNGKCQSITTDLRHLGDTLTKQASAAEDVLAE